MRGVRLQGSRLRIALYSHDTMGMGHTRRNLLLASTLAKSPSAPVVLLIAGAWEAHSFALPPGVDCLTLPAFQKSLNGGYRPRRLEIGLESLVALRGAMIRTALQEFRPDVVIVDKVPAGALGELRPALSATRPNTQWVLGLRDVLDEPQAVAREWSDGGYDDLIRKHYSAVWVYGDASVYDPVREYNFSADVAARVRHTGYLDRGQPRVVLADDEEAVLRGAGIEPGPFVLCSVGGGQDGGELAAAFAAARYPEGTTGVLLTGPFMPPASRRAVVRVANERSDLRIIDFLPDPLPLVRRAERVIGMGGYNTVCELLSLEKRALIVPRVRPRLEQWIRAERLHQLGLISVLHPGAATPAALSNWLATDVPLPTARDRIDLNGLNRLSHFLTDLTSDHFHRSESCDLEPYSAAR